MYTVAVVPVAVGSTAAYAAHGQFDVLKFGAFLLAAVLIIAWMNLSNDGFDHFTGVDANGRKAESVVILLGGSEKSAHKVIAVSFIFLAVGLSLFPIFADGVFLCIMLPCVLLGYMYQGPPFRLSYVGLGEPICFITWFGTVVASFHMHAPLGYLLQEEIQAPLLPPPIFAPKFLLTPAAIVAATTTLVLYSSHFHQRASDLAAKKKSPVVRLGLRRASKLHSYLSGIAALGLPLLGVVAHLCALVFGVDRAGRDRWMIAAMEAAAMPPMAAAGALVAGAWFAALAGRFLWRNIKREKELGPLKYYFVKMLMAQGLAMVVGLTVTGALHWAGLRDDAMREDFTDAIGVKHHVYVNQLGDSPGQSHAMPN